MTDLIQRLEEAGEVFGMKVLVDPLMADDECRVYVGDRLVGMVNNLRARQGRE